MNINKSRTIESKITIYFILIIIIIFTVLWSSFMYVFNYSYKEYQLNKIYEVKKLIYDEKESELNIFLDDLSHEKDVCIIKIDTENNEIGYNLKLDSCALLNRNNYLNELIYNFDSGEKNEVFYEFINESNHAQAALLGIKYDNENIFIYTTLADTSEISSIFHKRMLYLSILSIIITIIASYFISKKIVGPLTNITSKAKLLGTREDILFEKNNIIELDNLVDALNLAQSEIWKTHGLQRDLMANVSHDLKTPLTMIKAYAEMCRDISYKNKPKLDNHLNIIIDETNRLTLLVNDILDMAKLQDKKDGIISEKYDLSTEINQLIKKYEIIKETENYNFIVDIPKKTIIEADKSKLNQVVYNLLNNAINYTGSNKNIYITVKKRTFGVLVEIRDTGKGINKDDINNIWDKYYMTDKNHKRNVVSSGIGLSIVKEILLLHGYEYGVRSSSKGTVFYFIIK